MDGFRATEGFMPHHRMAAARELIAIGFGPAAATIPEPATPTKSSAQPIQEYEPMPNPFEEIFPPEVMKILESDEPLDCPCADDGGDSCPNNDYCPYYWIEFPEISDEQSERIKKWVMSGMKRRAEALGLEAP